MVSLDNINDLLENLKITNKRPLLIGIDGRPCSGKSALADSTIYFASSPQSFGDAEY